MVCRHALPDHSPIISTRSSNEEFVLDVNITPNYDTFNVKQLRKIDTFFDLVDSLQMHPEATHKILHFCGVPRCSTHLPRLQNSRACRAKLVAKRRVAKLVDVEPENNRSKSAAPA